MAVSSHSSQSAAEVEGFLDALDALAQAVRRARGSRTRALDHQLTLSQYGLLLPLVDQGEARIRDLAEAAGITAPTATRILDALERGGVLRRATASDDRRAVSVTLTAEGRALLESRHTWIRERQRAFYASLDPDERVIAARLLHGVADLIDSLAAGP